MRSVSTDVRTARVRSVALVVGLLCLTAVLAGVFAKNPLRSADQNFFLGWDRESQALVLATVQQARNGTAPAWGLSVQEPDLLAPYSTFDGGATTAGDSFMHYPSQIGLQAGFFTLASDLGAATIGALTNLESLLFAVGLVGFLTALWRTVSRGLAVATLLTSIASPWVVSAAHNLYWVPWTWLLPAIAACVLVGSRSRGARLAAGAAVVVTVALKAACGYEFISTVIVLAAGMPLLAALRARRGFRRALVDAGAVIALGLLGFLIALVVHAMLAGGGSLAAGVHVIVEDAVKRTYGSPRADLDATTRYSLTVSPLAVLVRYLLGWQTDLLALGVGTPLALESGPYGLVVLLAAAAGMTVVTAARRDRRWITDAGVLCVTAAAPVSWYVLAKSHAFTAVGECYVLWYLILVPAALWVTVRAVVSLPVVTRMLLALRTRARARSPRDRSDAAHAA